jgi:hypothetical protein
MNVWVTISPATGMIRNQQVGGSIPLAGSSDPPPLTSARLRDILVTKRGGLIPINMA